MVKTLVFVTSLIKLREPLRIDEDR
jgi:hypothetical protein